MRKVEKALRIKCALVLCLALFATVVPLSPVSALTAVTADQVLSTEPDCTSVAFRIIDLGRCADQHLSAIGHADLAAEGAAQITTVVSLAAAAGAIGSDEIDAESQAAVTESAAPATCPEWTVTNVLNDPNGDWDGDSFTNVFELYNGLNPCEFDTVEPAGPETPDVAPAAPVIEAAAAADEAAVAEDAPGEPPVVFNPCPGYSIEDVYADVNGDWDADGTSNLSELDAFRDPCVADASASSAPARSQSAVSAPYNGTTIELTRSAITVAVIGADSVAVAYQRVAEGLTGVAPQAPVAPSALFSALTLTLLAWLLLAAAWAAPRRLRWCRAEQ